MIGWEGSTRSSIGLGVIPEFAVMLIRNGETGSVVGNYQVLQRLAVMIMIVVVRMNAILPAVSAVRLVRCILMGFVQIPHLHMTVIKRYVKAKLAQILGNRK